MKFRRILITFLLMTFCLPSLANKVYVYRDAQGILVFSDRPHPGAEVISAKSKIESIPSLTATSSVTHTVNQNEAEIYAIRIQQPQDQSTIRDNSGSVSIACQITPALDAGYKIRVLLDGQIAHQPEHRTIFNLRNIERGEHQLKVELIDPNGKLIASSLARTFYMHRASVIKAK